MGVKPFIRVPKSLVLDGTLSAVTKGIYNVIAVYCDDQSRKGTPSRNKIAKSAGVSNSTLSRHLDLLVTNGYISIEKRYSKHDGKRLSNLYILHDT